MPNGSRATIGGGVRMLIATNAAPCSARSVAISAPLLPIPTTSTRLPAYGRPLVYSAECDSRPRYVSRPGQLGISGMPYCPTAITTARQRHMPHALSTSHAAPLSMPQPVNRTAGDDLELEVAGVGPQIRGVLVLRWIFGVWRGSG